MHKLTLVFAVDEEALAEWKADPRSNNELPVATDPDEWEFRDLRAACERGIVDEMEVSVEGYEEVEGASA